MDEREKSILIFVISTIVTFIVIFLGLILGIVTITKEERKDLFYYEKL